MAPGNNQVFLPRSSSLPGLPRAEAEEPEEQEGPEEPEKPAEPEDPNKPAEPEDPDKPVELQSNESFDMLLMSLKQMLLELVGRFELLGANCS